MDGWVRLCATSDLAEGCARGFGPAEGGRDTVFVVRRHGLHAYRNSCPHWPQTSLPWRKDAYLDAQGTRIVCSAHGAQFEIETGLCLTGPCIGESLTRAALREKNGSLYVERVLMETNE